jgi:hypothetical protein
MLSSSVLQRIDYLMAIRDAAVVNLEVITT